MRQILQNTTIAKWGVIVGDLILLNLLFGIASQMWLQYFGLIELDGYSEKYVFFFLVNLFYLPSIILWPPPLIERFINSEDILSVTFKMLLLHGAAVTVYLFVCRQDYSRIYADVAGLNIFIFYSIWYVALFLWRIVCIALVRRLRSSEIYKQRYVAFVGTNDSARDLWFRLHDAGLGYRCLGYFSDTPDKRWSRNGTEYLGLVSGVDGWIERSGVEEIYCCLDFSDKGRVEHLYRVCEEHCVRFIEVPNLLSFPMRNMRHALMGDVLVLKDREEPLLNQGNRIIKRVFDFVVSALFLITLFPVIYLVVALITKITSPGPVLFKQERSGLNGKVFTIYKFRTMRMNNESDSRQAERDDPRKTPFGNFLRKSNIDELPQLINVLKGEMSLVGPRPHMLQHTEFYSNIVKRYMVRHLAKPGLTGWAQVTGFRGETKELWRMEGRVRKDIFYIENWSVWLDIKIIFMTIANIIKGDKQAY